jgi:ATP-dependent exoDNAse (exonuclease V) beta subunit
VAEDGKTSIKGEHTMSFNITNTHERDALIQFDAAEHKYRIDGIEAHCSVTGLIGRFFPEFDAEKTIETFYDRWQANKGHKYFNKSKQQIAEEWEKNGTQSRNLGTKLHKAIEDFYENSSPDISEIEKEYSHFQTFYQKHQHLTVHRTEWRLCTDNDCGITGNVGIAGTVDMCFEENGVLHIYDWKRANEIKRDGFKGQTGFSPVARLQNANFIHYSLQLNLYKYILENYYGKTVGNMYLVLFHPDNSGYIECKVGDLQKEVSAILKAI